MIPILSSIRYHYDRWRGVREASAGLPRPTGTERAYIDDLREGIRRLAVEPTDGLTPNQVDWARASNRLRELVLRSDPRAFLRWDVIIQKMAVRDSPITAIELAALQARPDWSTRWRSAISETAAGRPYPFALFPESSEPLIQTAYALSRLEELAGRPVDAWDAVIEFGGGFGSLCRLMHQLGFRGRYVIFDLPQFTLLQRYFLRSAGIIENGDNQIELTSDLVRLEQIVAGLPEDARATFVACWSLSETPLTLRAKVRPLVERIGRYCIAYQERYGEVDNVDYFTNHWLYGPRRSERIAHRASDHFLAGEVR